jgi:hypothetical protein
VSTSTGEVSMGAGVTSGARAATSIDSDRGVLSREDLARIAELVPRGSAQGERDPSRHLADLHSER